MFGPARALWAFLLLAGGGEHPPPKLLVLPIMGLAPREMALPGAEEIGQAVLLQCEAGELQVAVEQPTGRALPEEAEMVFAARGREIGAVAVVWGELVEPADCSAPRRIRMRLLEISTQLIIERILCPNQGSPGDIARAMGLAVVNALHSGALASLAPARHLEKPPTSKGKACAPPAACPPCSACPPCPAPAQPPPAPKYPQAPHFIQAGVGISTHPRLRDPSPQLSAGVFFSPTGFLEIGLELVAQRATNIAAGEVSAVYQTWPVTLSGRLRWGATWQFFAGLEILLAVNHLDALLKKIPDAVGIDRFDPALGLCAGVRWWPKRSLALQLGACGDCWLRVQRYNYLYLGLPLEVLRLDRFSASAQLQLVVPWRMGDLGG